MLHCIVTGLIVYFHMMFKVSVESISAHSRGGELGYIDEYRGHM